MKLLVLLSSLALWGAGVAKAEGNPQNWDTLRRSETVEEEIDPRGLATTAAAQDAARACALNCAEACLRGEDPAADPACASTYVARKCAKLTAPKKAAARTKCVTTLKCLRAGGKRCSDKSCARRGTQCCPGLYKCPKGCAWIGSCCGGERLCEDKRTCVHELFVPPCCPEEKECDHWYCVKRSENCTNDLSASPFTLAYAIDSTQTPTPSDYEGLAGMTSAYLQGIFTSSPFTDYLSTSTTTITDRTFVPDSPVVVQWSTVVTFTAGTTAITPPFDKVIAASFLEGGAAYQVLLSALTGNYFSTTSSFNFTSSAPPPA